MAETKKKSTAAKAAKSAPTEKETEREEAVKEVEKTTFTREEVQAMIAEALRTAQSAAPATIVQVTNTEKVTLMFTAPFAEGTVVTLGELGQINRPFTPITVPKDDFLQKRSYKVDRMLRDRRLVVTDGLTKEESERFDLVYSDGEVLTQNIYYKLLDFPDAEIVKIFNALCEENKKTIATVFITAYFEDQDKRITQSKVSALNKASKSVDPDGLFTPILADMGEKMME